MQKGGSGGLRFAFSPPYRILTQPRLTGDIGWQGQDRNAVSP